MNEEIEFFRLAVALGSGLLIGLERGWQGRAAASGGRVAGIRTFALIAVLGAGWGLVVGEASVALLGFAFVGFAIILTAAYVLRVRREGDYGITTAIAALLTFVLGAAAMRGHTNFVAAAAVITAIVLGVKPILHGWIQRLDKADLYAVFKLTLISLVVLPVLPDRGYGPWQALNPYEIWWLVVLVAGVSFSGYFAMKAAGPKRGLGLTALFGGLVSSTAVTLNFSRFAVETPHHRRLLAAGILIAAAMMFPRTVVLAGILHPPLVLALVYPLIAMSIVCFGAAAYFWKTSASEGRGHEPQLSNPLELANALKFGLLLAVVMLLARALRHWFGDAGIYVVAILSGITDIDAATLSMSRLANDDLATTVAARAIVFAAVANTLFKGALAAIVTRSRWALLVAAPLTVSIALGLALTVIV